MHLLVTTPYRPASVTYPETTVEPAPNGQEPAPQRRLELRYMAAFAVMVVVVLTRRYRRVG